MTAQPRIVLDRDRCLGAGICTFHAPETFDISDDDVKVVLLDTRDPVPAIREAAQGCPNHVISLIEEEAAEEEA